MFNFSYLLSFFLLLFLPSLNAVAITAVPSVCIVTKTIQTNQWTQIGIPCEAPADQNTIAAIFSDDIPGTYDTDWVLYSFNPTTNAYEKPAFTDTVEAGKGYWIISANQSATLDMPFGSQPVNIQSSTQCLFAAGCFETVLVANPGAAQYQMLASPFDNSVLGESFRLNSGLETGLTLEESETEDIFAHQLWNYNQTTNEYDEIQNQIISPWTGFWVATLPTASNSPAAKLLFPSSQTQVNLHVTATTGANLTDVNVTVLKNGIEQSMATITENGGEISFPLEPEVEYILSFSKQGFANQVQRIKTPTAGQKVNLDVLLIPRGTAQAVANQPNVTLSGTDGATVSLSNPEFVDSQGNAVNVSQGIDLTITSIDVSTPAGVAAFPGDFAGTPEGQSNITPIASYGTVEYQFIRTSDGEELQLQPNQQAEIQIPIYVTKHQDGTDIATGDTIPLWSLNETTGLWTQEGSVTVVASANSPTGFALQAMVSHFTWWNCDVTMNPAQAIVTVTAPEAGTALIKARTNTDIGGWRPNTVDTVIEVGISTGQLPIPSNGEVCFWAEINFTSGNAATTPEICVTAAPNSTININLKIQGGDLNLTATPQQNVVAYKDLPAVQTKIQPTTAETTINYNLLSGELPPGMTLTSISNTTAMISGIPTEAGTYAAVIQGIDDESNFSTISITYIVNSGQAPLLVGGRFYPSGIFTQNHGEETIRFEDTSFCNEGGNNIITALANIGGTATQWSITNVQASHYWGFASDAFVPIEPQVEIDSQSGNLDISWGAHPSDFYGAKLTFTVIASNSFGVSEIYADMECSESPY